MAARATPLHHSLFALEPSMALASFSLSLLIQVHEAAAVVASGGDAGDEWRPAAASTRAAARRRGASVLAVPYFHPRGGPFHGKTRQLPDAARRWSPLDASIAAALHHRSCLMHLHE